MNCSFITLLLAGFTFYLNIASAQTPQDSVKQTVNQFFIAMKNADAKGLETCFADSAILQTIIHSESKTSVHNEQVNEFSTFIDKLQKGDADEQITFDVVKVDNELAIVWAPYKFYWKGKFSHCGTDSFQLVRLNGVWKIQYLIDTRRKEGCEL
jgi:putative lumazine-binding protein